MNFSLSEMIALQDVTTSDHDDASIKQITPTKFYVISSCILTCLGVYGIAALFAHLAHSAFNLRTADLIIQANYFIFIAIALALVVSPWLKMQRYQVKIRGDETQLFHYQESIVLLFGILFANIPLMFLAHAVAMYEQIAYMQTLNSEVLDFMQSSFFFHMPTVEGVWSCAIFGVVLGMVKTWVFLRVARRFIHNKRFRSAVRA